MGSTEVQDQLLRALRDRDIPAAKEDFQWAFESPDSRSEVVDWVQEYLGPETLLSKDELQLYTRLEKNNESRALVSKHDLSGVVPITDDELRSAISALESSTSTIRGHSEKLQEQKRALSALKEKNAGQAATRDRSRLQQHSKWQAEKEHMSLAVEELSDSLESQLDAVRQRTRSGSTKLNATLSQTLKGDDATLARLGKLIETLGPAVGDDAGYHTARDRAKKLCNKLVSLKTEEIQCRLDRIFLENRMGPAHDREGEDVERQHVYDEDMRTLKEEVDSLYPEITSVAQMSIEREFGHPLLQQIESQQANAKQISGDRLQYALATLEHLTLRLDVIASRASEYESHCKAVQTVSSTFKAEPSPPTAKRSMSPSNPQSPLKTRHQTAASGSPERGAASRRRSSVDASALETSPEQQLLATLGLSYADLSSQENLGEALSEALTEQRSRIRSQLASLENSTDAALANHLDPPRVSLQLLRDALLENTQYGTMTLIDEEIKARMAELEHEVGELGRRVSSVDLEPLQQTDKRREKFVERWTR